MENIVQTIVDKETGKITVTESPEKPPGKLERWKAKARASKENLGRHYSRFIGNDLVKRFYPDALMLAWAVGGYFFLASKLFGGKLDFFVGFYFAVLTAPFLLSFGDFIASKLGFEN